MVHQAVLVVPPAVGVVVATMEASLRAVARMVSHIPTVAVLLSDAQATIQESPADTKFVEIGACVGDTKANHVLMVLSSACVAVVA